MRGMRDYGPFRITLKHGRNGYEFAIALRIAFQVNQPAPFLTGTSAFAENERQAFQDAEKALKVFLEQTPLFNAGAIAPQNATNQEVARA